MAELQKIGKALRPGGVLLFDLLVQTVGEPMAYRHWSAGDDWAVLVEVAEDKTQRQVQREITIFRQVGELYRRSHETHRVHVHACYQVERASRGRASRSRSRTATATSRWPSGGSSSRPASGRSRLQAMRQGGEGK